MKNEKDIESRIQNLYVEHMAFSAALFALLKHSTAPEKVREQLLMQDALIRKSLDAAARQKPFAVANSLERYDAAMKMLLSALPNDG